MTAYELTICAHVVVAILGVGQVTGLTVLASLASKLPSVPGFTWVALKRLVRGASWSLVVMLLTGLVLEYLAGWSHREAWWFRIAFLLFVICGALLGMIQGKLRKGEAAGDARALRGVAVRSGLVCGLVAVIAGLMQLKPW